MGTVSQTSMLRCLAVAALCVALTLTGSAEVFAYDPGPELYGEGVESNVAIPMREGVELSADIHYPTEPDVCRQGPVPGARLGDSVRQGDRHVVAE